jgi:hypothetical protein
VTGNGIEPGADVKETSGTGGKSGADEKKTALEVERVVKEKATAFVPGEGLFVKGELVLRDGEAVYVEGMGVLVEGEIVYVEDTGVAGAEAPADGAKAIPLVSKEASVTAALANAVGELSVFNPETGAYEERDAKAVLARDAAPGAQDALASGAADDLRINGGVGRLITPIQQSGIALVVALIMLAGVFLLILYRRLAQRRERR